ncbi:hypothetical protein, partial [Xylella fastidiosa]|uniref:hypothetical protein n=1 Tax=Xylella fastidiosa TaxID=2371 RepID=UPI001FC84820
KACVGYHQLRPARLDKPGRRIGGHLAEKPSVAKAIAGELGVTGKSEGYIECGHDTITWCFGHMLEQAEPDA